MSLKPDLFRTGVLRGQEPLTRPRRCQGVVRRDVRTSTILVTAEDRPKLLDFDGDHDQARAPSTVKAAASGLSRLAIRTWCGCCSKMADEVRVVAATPNPGTHDALVRLGCQLTDGIRRNLLEAALQMDPEVPRSTAGR